MFSKISHITFLLTVEVLRQVCEGTKSDLAIARWRERASKKKNAYRDNKRFVDGDMMFELFLQVGSCTVRASGFDCSNMTPFVERKRSRFYKSRDGILESTRFDGSRLKRRGQIYRQAGGRIMKVLLFRSFRDQRW